MSCGRFIGCAYTVGSGGVFQQLLRITSMGKAKGLANKEAPYLFPFAQWCRLVCRAVLVSSITPALTPERMYASLKPRIGMYSGWHGQIQPYDACLFCS